MYTCKVPTLFARQTGQTSMETSQSVQRHKCLQGNTRTETSLLLHALQFTSSFEDLNDGSTTFWLHEETASSAMLSPQSSFNAAAPCWNTWLMLFLKTSTRDSFCFALKCHICASMSICLIFSINSLFLWLWFCISTSFSCILCLTSFSRAFKRETVCLWFSSAMPFLRFSPCLKSQDKKWVDTRLIIIDSCYLALQIIIWYALKISVSTTAFQQDCINRTSNKIKHAVFA